MNNGMRKRKTMVALWNRVSAQRARAMRNFERGAAWCTSRSRSVKNDPMATVIEDENNTTVATRNTIDSMLRRMATAKNGVSVSTSAVARKSRAKSAKSPNRKRRKMKATMSVRASDDAVRGRSLARVRRRGHIEGSKARRLEGSRAHRLEGSRAQRL